MATPTHPGALATAGGAIRQVAVRSVAVRKYAGKAAAAAMSEKHTATAVGAGAVLGLLERNDVPLPYIDMLGRAGTYGLVAWAAGRYTGNQMAQHAASGLLAIAAYELAKGNKPASSGVSGEVLMGEVSGEV